MSDLDLQTSPATRGSSREFPGRGCLPVLIALAVVVGVLGVVIWRGTDVVSGWFADPDDYAGAGAGAVRVEVRDGDSATDIGVTLERAGVVASVEAFTDAAAADPRSIGIQPGLYQLNEQMSAQAALSSLVRGAPVIDTAVSVPEGFTVAETIDLLVDEGRLPRDALVRATRSPQRLGLPGWAGGDLEGYLYPASYQVDRQAAAADVLTQMVAQFSRAATELSIADRAKAMDVTPQQIVTIASLVQAEASRPQDFGKVARTIYNRLDTGMRLQLDSTVHFANGDDSGDVFTSQEQRNNPSLYNTYRHGGLPPGPINSPGQRALQAALDPTRGNWRFFVTVDLSTGKTLFARSFAEHKRNTAKLRAYCADSAEC